MQTDPSLPPNEDGGTAAEQECERLRAALVASETRFSVLFNHLTDGIIVIDADSAAILTANLSACKFLGLSQGELTGRHLSSLLPAEDSKAGRASFLDNLETRGHTTRRQQFVLGGGERREATLSAVIVRWDGAVAVLLCVKRDKPHQEHEWEAVPPHELQDRLDAVTRLTRDMSNPLQELMAYAQLHRQEAIAKPIQRMAETMAHLRSAGSTGRKGGDGDAVALTMTPNQQEPVNQAHLLLVDDEPNLRELFKRALMKRFPDVRVDVAANGAEALPLFKSRHHSIVIMDVDMPVMGGSDAFRALLSICREKNWEVPSIIFCTGFDVPASIRDAMDTFPNHTCMLKPVNINDLRDEVSQRLGRT